MRSGRGKQRTISRGGDAARRRKAAGAKPIENMRPEDHAKLRAMFYSIGDGLLSTDASDRVERLNPAAEGLTGWTEEEACGRPAGEVLRVVDPLTREPLEIPLASLFREDRVVGVGSHGLLIARDGRERVIGFHGAPLRGDAGAMLGGVIVLRDQTAEQHERRFADARLAITGYVAEHSLEALLDRALEEIATFADSPYGFYQFLGEEGGTGGAQRGAMLLGGMSCQIPDQERHAALDLAGAWADCVRLKRPVVVNDYDSQATSARLPKGHSPLRRFIAVPVIRDERAVAVVCLGNKRDAYTPRDAEVVSHLADVTWEILRRKRAEQEVRSGEAHVRRAQSLARMGSWHWNLANERLDWSAELYRMWAWDPDVPLTREGIASRIHPDDRERNDHILEELLKAGDAVTFEFRIGMPDGSLKEIRQSIEVSRDDRGRARELFGVMQDISTQKEAERRLRESQQDLALAQRVAQIGSWKYDVRADTVRWSEELFRLYGLDPRTVCPGLEHAIGMIHADDRPDAEAAFRRAIEEGVPYQIVYRILRPDGTERVIEGIGRIDRDAAGRIVSIYGTAQDVTEREQMNAPLRASHERLRTVFEQSAVGMALVRPDGGFLQVNSRLCDIVGYEEAELCRMSFRDITHPDDLHLDDTEVARVLAGEQDAFEIAKRYVHKRGHSVWIRLYSNAVREEDGRVKYAIAAASDISQERTAAESLRESEAKFRALVENTIDWVWQVDAQGRYVYVSPNAEQLIGYSPEELLGCTPFDLMDDAEARRVGALFGRFLDQRQRIVALEDTLRHKDGHAVVFETNGAPLFDEQGNLRGYFGTCRDITERRRVAEALRESERQKQLILDSAAEMIAYHDTDLRILWANRAAGASVGMAADALVGRHCYEVWNDSDTPCDGCPVLRARDEKTPHQCERQTPDGRWWYLRGYPVLDADGNVISLVEFGQDITAHIQAEGDAARLEEQFRQAQKLESVGRLAGGVAHDLNNLLSPILGYSEMLLEDAAGGPAADPRRESLEAIVQAGRRARDLVRQLLAFSRRQALEFRRLDINALILSFERLMQRAIREDIEIRTGLASDLPAIRGDAGQLEQVLMNLAVNAQDAMSDGGTLTIETALVELDEAYAADREGVAPGQYIRLTVSDTGCGMNAEQREQIFEPFFTTKDREKGTGLGLSTVYGIVKQHGGNVWAYSEPGMGATFKVYLPVSEGEADARESAPPRAADLQGTETIILAEDNEQVRDLARTVLERHGYHVISAAGGEEALGRLRGHEGPVHLLLTDVVMPEMNGKELYESLRCDHPDLKVLYMSGYTDDVIVRRGVIEDGVQFIQKPFTIQGLASKVRAVLDQT
ncbi:MAG: PAS domain S-box protein [Candidatus Eisenbacteria bacterium]|nr:PAS domain S-box protein [Candidatus Eisenbacteria bacterium]